MYQNLKETSGLRFSNCDFCEKSCCDGGQFILAPLILEDVKAVYKNFLVAFARIDHKLRLVMLISNRIKPCLYYENKQCTIYDNRPPACHLYPITPFYDQVLVDSSCHAVGTQGTLLWSEGKVDASFYHERLENFDDKVQKCEQFLANLDWKFRPIFEIDGITLLEYVGVQQNSFIQMHKASLPFLKEWI